MPVLSIESIERVYGEIARILKITLVTDSEDIKELVKEYLSSEAAGKWLLLVDNADDINLVFGGAQQTHSIINYLP
jgi:hypothetical protein